MVLLDSPMDEVMTVPTMTWRRLTRRLRPGRNPLRRRSDLIEAWIVPAVIIAFLVLGPVVAAAAGLWVRADNAATHRAQLSWQRVPAVLLAAAPGPMMTDHGANSWVDWMPARWTAGGRPRTGNVPAAAGTRAGSAVPVWLDRAGHVRLPALTPAQTGRRVVAAASLALTALAVLLAGVALLGRLVLDRRRLAAWETAWLAVGPRWRHQG
jgi:ABC-type Na+ efflux pump permease subunit